MCPYCKDGSRVIVKIEDNKRVEVSLKPDAKYYRETAMVAVCRGCKKEFLITSEYKADRACPYFCIRKFEEVEVME